MSDDLKREIAAIVPHDGTCDVELVKEVKGLVVPCDCQRGRTIDKLLPLFDRVIVASFEEAARWLRSRDNGIIAIFSGVLEGIANEIERMPPAKVRLRAEIRELEREAEARWWHAQRGHHGQNWCCDRVAAISQELAEKRAAYEQLKGTEEK